MSWFRLRKERSKFGEWIDKRGLTQQEIAERSGVNRNTVGELANDTNARPSWKTRRKLDRGLTDIGFRSDDFWGPPM